MDLTTTYLGLQLAHPFMPGASPLDEDLDMVVRLEDAGAAAIVMHSLFEEEIAACSVATDRYLERLLRIKRRVRIPVIASLNGTTAEGWLKYATLIDRAGADAIELNYYHVATDLLEDSALVEQRLVDIVAVLKESVVIPLAVKLSPFYSALPHLAAELDRIGADGLVLFNRFYQPDIDPAARAPVSQLRYSDPSELLLRLRWIAILAGRVRPSLALTGGAHEPLDAVKAVMAGADAVQLVSALLKHGPGRLTAIRDGFARWGDEHGFASVGEMRGCVSLSRCPHPEGFERANYFDVLQSGRLQTASGAGH
jgi:dihydroorotate dehydrogenase (fumarate)